MMENVDFAAVPYKVYARPVSSKVSPRAGLLAVARAFRGLSLPQALHRHMICPFAKGDHLASMVESLVLLQAAGADCVSDAKLLSSDPCLTAGLGYQPVGPMVARCFVTWLGKSGGTDGHAGFQGILAHSAAAGWKVSRENRRPEIPRGRQITIDVVALPFREAPSVTWTCSPQGIFPCRIVCLWREGDLILSGGVCSSMQMIIDYIDAALRAVPEQSYGRLIRAGVVCCRPEVISWLAHQKLLLSGGDWRSISRPVGFVIGSQYTPEMIAAIGAIGGAWSQEGVMTGNRVEWKEVDSSVLTSPIEGSGIRHIALRRKIGSGDSISFDYSGFVTNRKRGGGAMTTWFLKGASEVNRILDDLDALARGPSPGALMEKTGEGRFRLALLTYNICAAIRKNCFEPGEREVPMSRFRELLVHSTGRIVRSERTRWLKLSQPKVKFIFGNVRRRFPMEEKATL